MCDSKFYCSIHVLPCSITHLILSLASLALADAHTQISHALSLWLWLSKHWGLSPTGVEVLGHVRYTANRNAKLWSPSLCKTRYLEYITLNHFNCDLPTTHSRDPAPVRAFQIPFPSKLSAFFTQRCGCSIYLAHKSCSSAHTICCSLTAIVNAQPLAATVHAQAHKCLEEAEMGMVCILPKLILHHL